jgi:hypothetical protein
MLKAKSDNQSRKFETPAFTTTSQLCSGKSSKNQPLTNIFNTEQIKINKS